MNIIRDFKNELFKRQELVVDIESEKNPSFDEVKKMVAEKVGKSEENIDVKKVKGGFGQRKFRGEVYIYDSKESLENMKKMTSKQRKGGDKKESEEKSEPDIALVEEKEEEKEAEKKPTEAPAEDKAEEEAKAVEEEAQKEEEAKEP